MDVATAIFRRRAVRVYRDESVDRPKVERLIDAAIQAPSAMDLEPWAFVVFEGKDRLREFSDEIKRELLDSPEAGARPALRSMLSDPAFDIFYGAPVLILVCATSSESQAAEDCCLAAQNLMLAAHDSGLASCPIGFARKWLSSPSTKHRLGIPELYVPVFPLIVGHPKEETPPHGRRPAVILWR